MAQILSGLASIRVDGQVFESDGEFTVTLGGSKNEGVTLASGKTYINEMLVPGKIAGSMAVIPGFSASQIKAIRSATIQIQSRSGTVYAMRNAFFSLEGEISVKDGKLTVEFMGDPVDEVL